MKDGIIKGAGNSRFLKTVENAAALYPNYQDFISALMSGTLPVDFNGINEAGWDQIGTALSKENILKDETAALFGLDENATPDDVFCVVYDAQPKVGDIKITARTDLDDNWLLCNGVKVSREAYEKLSEITPSSLQGEWNLKDFWLSASTLGDCSVNCITYANGYWVACGGGYSDALIAYTTDPTGEWTTKTLWSASGRWPSINGIIYENGYWVVCGETYVSNKYTARIAYTTDLAGTWTTKNLWNSSNAGNRANCIAYADGYWVVGGEYAPGTATDSRIAYTTDLTGDWTTKDLSTSASEGSSINCIFFANGYWVAGEEYYNSTSFGQIRYATTPSGSWTAKTLWSIEDEKHCSVDCITYANGYWVAGGRWYDGSSWIAMLAYATDPTGSWTTQEMYKTDISGGINGVVYAKGLWVVSGKFEEGSTSYARLSFARELAGYWQSDDLWGGTTKESFINCITYADGYWLAGGQSGTTGYLYARIGWFDDSFMYLPTISIDNVYTYIKAKE